MLTKDKVAGWAILPSGVIIFVWPQSTYFIVGAFYLLTFAMLLTDRPRGELFPPPDVDADQGLDWMLQPRWVKAFTTWIGFPAWLVLIGGMAPPVEPPDPIAISAFGATVVLQMVFIARAYWRMDI